MITIQDAYDTGKLRKIFEGLHPECIGNAITTMSEINAFTNRFKEITGIGFGEPIKDVNITDDNITELNYRTRDIDRSIKSLCTCINKTIK